MPGILGDYVGTQSQPQSQQLSAQTSPEYLAGIEMLKRLFDPRGGFSQLSIPNAETRTRMAAAPSQFAWNAQYPWQTNPLLSFLSLFAKK